jgi:SsrA-binding protein
MAKEGTYKSPVEIINRKARYEYHINATFEAGMMLTGTEVKSIRAGQAQINDAYCLFQGEELFLRNMHISEYKDGGPFNHEPRRVRKLLLKKNELKKLFRRSTEKGFTIIPLRIHISERGLIKCDVALVQGKKSFDKRETIKQKDVERDLERHKKVR